MLKKESALLAGKTKNLKKENADAGNVWIKIIKGTGKTNQNDNKLNKLIQS